MSEPAGSEPEARGQEAVRQEAAGQEAVGRQPVVVDARGLRCPLPVIRLAQRAHGCPPGTVVEVLATDPAAAADIPAWCRMRGQEYLGSEHRPGQPGEDEHAAYRVRLSGPTS